MIHETAIIDPAAKLGKNVSVGAYSIIGAKVTIGDDTEIGPHVTINGTTKIGKKNKFYQYSSIGEDPQDLKYAGEETFLELGDGNIVREFCTLNRGTGNGGGLTKIGNSNLLMAYAHVAHDCVVGNNIVLANNASLAGHVQVDDFAILGGLSAVHQFCRVGSYSFAAGGSMIAKDVPPFVMVSGYYAKPFGLNSEGLRRKGFSEDVIAEIKKLYRVVYRKNLTLKEALVELHENFDDSDARALFLEVLENTQRGIVR